MSSPTIDRASSPCEAEVSASAVGSPPAVSASQSRYSSSVSASSGPVFLDPPASAAVSSIDKGTEAGLLESHERSAIPADASDRAKDLISQVGRDVLLYPEHGQCGISVRELLSAILKFAPCAEGRQYFAAEILRATHSLRKEQKTLAEGLTAVARAWFERLLVPCDCRWLRTPIPGKV